MSFSAVSELAFADGDLFHFIALGDRIDHVLAFGHLAENRMLAVEPWGFDMGDEELRSIGVRAGVGHRENARTIVLQVGMKFVLKLVARTAGAGALRTTGLDHEVFDHAVELQTVVKAIAGKLFEVADRLGDLVFEQFQLDGALIGFDGGNFHRDSLISFRGEL